MPTIITFDAILERLGTLQEKVSIIEAEIANETSRPFRNQRARLLAFLYKEHCVYAFAVSELKRLLSKDEA